MKYGVTSEITSNIFRNNHWDIGVGNGMEIDTDRIMNSNEFEKVSKTEGIFDIGWSSLSWSVSCSNFDGSPATNVKGVLLDVNNNPIIEAKEKIPGSLYPIDTDNTPFDSIIKYPIKRIFGNQTEISYYPYSIMVMNNVYTRTISVKKRDESLNDLLLDNRKSFSIIPKEPIIYGRIKIGPADLQINDVSYSIIENESSLDLIINFSIENNVSCNFQNYLEM